MADDEFVKYTVPEVTIDGRAFTPGEKVKLTVHATVGGALPGEPPALRVDDAMSAVSLPPDESSYMAQALRDMGLTSYAEYLTSDWWAFRRDLYIATQDYVCGGFCGTPLWPLSLHHKTYLRLGFELDRDLCWMCDVCHPLIHATGVLDPDAYWTAEGIDKSVRPAWIAAKVARKTRAQRLVIAERYGYTGATL